MAGLADLRAFSTRGVTGHRLLNTKFPPIPIFDDVADAGDFDALFALQALTNPRLRAEAGDLSLLPPAEIPFGIPGCSYAAASFTHVNPDGTRFSDGSYGVFYVGESSETAIAEVRHHQGVYWSNVPGLHYERFVFKELLCTFDIDNGLDATVIPAADPMYASDDYTASRALGLAIKQRREHCSLRYHSVRNPGGVCHALFTPRFVRRIIPATHYEMIWSEGAIQSVNVLTGGQS